MILYVLIAAFVAGVAGGGLGVNWWKDAQIARAEEAQRKAEMVVAAAAEEAEQEAANKIIDMQASFAAGELNAKTVTKTVYIKGQQIVANTPAFNNPACVIGADALQLLNGARTGTGVQLAAAATGGNGAVPGAGSPAGRANGNAVPANAAGHGAVGGVPPPARATGGTDPVPGTSPRGVPKNPLAK
jgi:hypothetical protein